MTMTARRGLGLGMTLDDLDAILLEPRDALALSALHAHTTYVRHPPNCTRRGMQWCAVWCTVVYSGVWWCVCGAVRGVHSSAQHTQHTQHTQQRARAPTEYRAVGSARIEDEGPAEGRRLTLTVRLVAAGPAVDSCGYTAVVSVQQLQICG